MTSLIRRAAATALTLAVTGALLVGCGGGAAEDAKRPRDPDQAALFDKAVDEKAVYVYSNLEEVLNKRLSDGYAKAIGLPVTIEKIASSSINTRFASEAEARAVRADILVSADCSFVRAQVGKGIVVAMNKANVPGYEKYPENFKLDGGAVPSIQTAPYGIGYNTDEINKAEAPTTWDDLLDPRWKGRILMTSPKGSATRVQVYDFLLESRGERFLRDLGAQAARFYPDTGQAVAALAAGEGAILIPTAGQVTGAGAKKGAPLAFNLPEDTTGAPLCAGLSAQAPNPNAARLFLSYLLSKSGSEAVNGVEELYTAGPFDQGVKLGEKYKQPATVTEETAAKVGAALGTG
ncbi:ABC transporter substrate-binding protein [Actinomadura formosensis]|uniref:ABC transporter substrate-binding protein n=1 Tax=Actinomadura formosensis TaxID=60706 RepID=UPI0008307E92|nr:extracellular solute-binding protein [Actinomadura formosensis]